MCLFSLPLLPCDHFLCNHMTVGLAEFGLRHVEDYWKPLDLGRLLEMQGAAIHQVISQEREIEELIKRLGKVLDHRENRGREMKASPKAKEIRGNYEYEIVLDSKLKLPIMREASFALTGSVLATSTDCASALIGRDLHLALYTADSPPRLLAVNIVGISHIGKRILKGSIKAAVGSDGRFCFPKVTINEVSSHYVENEFTLAVSAEMDSVKPAFYRHLTVKARKKLRRRKTAPQKSSLAQTAQEMNSPAVESTAL